MGGRGGGELILYDTTIDWEATVSGCSAHKWTAINNGKGSKGVKEFQWSLFHKYGYWPTSMTRNPVTNWS